MINTLRIVLLSLSLALLLSACGGGSNDKPATAPTKAVVVLATTGTLPTGIQIGAISTTVTYPTNKQITISESDVFTSGVASNTTVLPNISTNGEVILANITGSSFGIGEFVTLRFSIAPNSLPLVSDFTVIPNTIIPNNSTVTGVNSPYIPNDPTIDLPEISVIVKSVTFE